MSEITSDLLIEKYESLIKMVDSLQEKIAKLTKYYETVSKKYDLYDSEIEKALKAIDSSKTNALSEISKKGVEFSELVTDTTKEIKNAIKSAKSATSALEVAIAKAEGVEISDDFETRISRLEERIQNGIIEDEENEIVPFDYEEILSAKEIWDKYNGKTEIPIIIKMPSWTGDYCMVMTDYNEDDKMICGRMYRNGVLYSTPKYKDGMRRFSGDREFQIFKSEYEDEIADSECGYI